MSDQDPFIGRDILDGQFKIVERIGSGAMGAVYKALQPEMNRMVAVKILHKKYTQRPDLASRFRREARAMSHLTHPNTAKVFVFGQLEDVASYIVMERLEGANLHQTLKAEGPFELARAIRILVQVCGALDEAHAAGIIHRDLKPENIFLCQQPTLRDFPKVLDFGLAKVTEREMRPGSMVITQEGMVFGTPEFMSPEQAEGKTLTPASDLYSLAIIFYEMITGALPFEGSSSTDFINAQLRAKPIPLNKRVPGKTFPEVLSMFFDRALQKDPADRFVSSREFSSALSACLEVVETEGPSSSVLSSPSYDSARESSLDEVVRKEASRHRPAPPAAAAVSMRLVVAVAAISLVVGMILMSLMSELTKK